MPGIRQNTYLICALVVCLFALVFLGEKLRGDTSPVVLDGQLVPGIPNARFSALRQASVNPSGTIAFFGQMDINGALSSGIFQVRDGVLSLVARRGEPLPDTPGRVFGLAFGDPQINKSGDIAFSANFEGNYIPRGIFISSAGVLRKVFDTNAPVPEIPDFYFNGVDPVRMNDAGNIAFVAELAPVGGGSGDSGLFLLSNGDLRLIARHVQRFAFNNRSDIAFVDQQGGITLFSNGVLRPIVVAGQIALNSSIKVSGPAEPWINDDGDVAFVNYGGVTMTGRGGSIPAPNAVLRWHNGTLTKIAAAGDPVPGLDGALFDISFSQPEINQSGVIFWNRTLATKDRASVAVIGRFQQEQLSTIVHGGELVEGLGPLDPHTGANFDNESGPVATILAATPAASQGIFALTFVRSTLLFPQVADGTSPGGDWRTTFIFANRSTSEAAAATITFYDNAGTPINIATAGQSQNPISISIPPLGVTRIQTDGTGELKVGWAKVQSDQNISGTALFAFSNASGKLASEVSASATTPLRSFSVFVDTGSDTSTGVAIVNPNAFANDITLILRDAASNEVARSSVSLPAMGHLSLYANELFPALPSGPFSGRIEVASAQNLVGLTLRQHEDVFTSLPIIP